MNNNFELIFFSMAISAVFYLILAVHKRYSKIWWTVGGALISLPIAMMIPALQNFFLKPYSIPNIAIYIVLYILVYSLFWIFAERNSLNEGERLKKEKLDHVIFEGFYSLRQKKLEDAYYYFKEGQSLDPNNRVINTMLESFDSGRMGQFNHNPILEKWFHFKSHFRKKENKIEIISKDSNKTSH